MATKNLEEIRREIQETVSDATRIFSQAREQMGTCRALFIRARKLADEHGLVFMKAAGNYAEVLELQSFVDGGASAWSSSEDDYWQSSHC